MFENSTQIIGLSVMVVAFIGIIICAKRQIQIGVIGGLLVLLTGVGIYANGTFNGDSGSNEAGVIYYCSITDCAGKEMKKAAPGKKVVYVVDPGMMNSKIAEQGLATFKAAFGSDNVEMVTIDVPPEVLEQGMDMTTYLKPKHIDDIIDKYPDAAFVLEIGLPEKAERISALRLPEAKRPVIFLTNSGSVSGKALSKMIKDGKIAGVIIGKPGKRNPDYEPDFDKLSEAFNNIYVVVNQGNLDKHKKSLE